MGYGPGDSFPFDFEPNGIQFGSKLKGNCNYDHIPFNVKGTGNIVFSVYSYSIVVAKQCKVYDFASILVTATITSANRVSCLLV